MGGGVLLFAAATFLATLPFLVGGRSVTTGSAAGAATGATAATKLVVDVDAGADDALALLLTLAEEARNAGPKVVAVTCVHGNTNVENVGRNVLKTLHLADRLDIPVYQGAAGSLLTTIDGDDYFGQDGLGDFEYPDAPDPDVFLQKEHAVNALIKLARENPGELTVLALGPLTNIALAIRMDPMFINNLKQLVVLGGSVEGVGNLGPGKEFNFFMDPEANFIVFNSTVNETKPILLVPWETIEERGVITMEWRKEVLGKIESKYVDFINKAERYQLETNDTEWASADGVAAAVLLRPDLITTSTQKHVDAETQGEYGRGAIFVDYKGDITPKNVVIVKTFNVENFKELLLADFSEM